VSNSDLIMNKCPACGCCDLPPRDRAGALVVSGSKRVRIFNADIECPQCGEIIYWRRSDLRLEAMTRGRVRARGVPGREVRGVEP